METGFLTVYWREMLKFNRSKIMLFVAIIQPALWLILFGIAMSNSFDIIIPEIPSIMSIDYLTFMAAGIIAMTILFTCLYSGISILIDKQFGLMKELVASPMPRSQILIGTTFSGMTKSFIQVIIIIVIGFVIGVQFFYGYSAQSAFVGIMGIFAFVALFSIGLMFLSSAIAMKIESHEAVQGVITLLTLPLFFLSNALYPIESFPAPLKLISAFNPLTHFIDGVRYFGIGSDFTAMGTEYSYETQDILISFTFLAGFAILMYFIAWRTFKNAVIA